MAKLTKAQRTRLDKLATYLEGLPKGYRHFDMETFIRGADRAAEAQYARKNGGVNSCGTAACAVGHGPAAGIFVPSKWIERIDADYWDVRWSKYSTLFIGSREGYPDAPPFTLFEWLFGETWSEFDNHHYGAAARIRWTLANGGYPSDFDEPAHRFRKFYAPYRIDAKPLATLDEGRVRS